MLSTISTSSQDRIAAKLFLIVKMIIDWQDELCLLRSFLIILSQPAAALDTASMVSTATTNTVTSPGKAVFASEICH